MSRKMKTSFPRVEKLACAFAMVAICFALLLPAKADVKLITFEDNWAEAGFNLIQQDVSGVEIVFSVPSMEVLEMDLAGERMQNVIIPGVILPNDAGAPNLPGMGRFIALPQGAWAELEVVEYRTEVFHDMNIAPAFVIPRGNDDSPLKYEKNPDIYNQDANYPAEPVMMSDLSKMRGVDIVTLGITPFQYNPVTGDLTVYKDIRVRVNFYGGNGHFGEDRLRSRWWEPVLGQNLINYESLPEVNLHRQSQTDEDNVEYIIIVPDDPAFLAWADTLKRWRNEQGIITGITTLTEIGGNNYTLIENYIDNAYHNWDIPPVAVLLLSDYQSSGDQYGITAPYYSYGYSCVSDNFYADREGNNDLPDIVLARITAQNYGDLTEMITKMLDYEREPYTDPGFYQHPLIAGGWQSDRWFILCCEVVWGYLHYELGKEPVRQYAGTSGPPSYWSTNANTYMIVDYFGPSGLGYIPETPSHLTNWSGNATGINNAINDGAFIVQHRDHGSVDGWGTPSYHNSNLSGLYNEMYPYVFSINCLTGKFDDNSECFTEAFHRMQYGALGVTAASNVSYSFVNDTYVWGTYDCMWPEFDPGYPHPGGDPVGEENLRPGFANASGKWYLEASSWPYNPQNKDETYYLFHHHGDAFVTLYSEVPQNLVVSHAPAVFGGITEFVVSANEGSLIGLSVDGVVVGAAEGTGTPITIPITPLTPGETMRVTVTKANYYRYIYDVPVVPPEGAYVAFNSCEINDAVVGNNNGQWDFGETVDLTIEVKNIGVEPAPDVNVNIATDDPLVTVIDGQEFYGTINAGDSLAVPDGFRVEVAPEVEDEHFVNFTLAATSGDSTWISYFTLLANAPIVTYDQLVIQDPTGNNNGALDPGETADFLLSMINDGHSTAENIEVIMTSSDPDVTIVGNPGTYGTLVPSASSTYTYVVTADPGMQSGTLVTITLDITADGGYVSSEDFDLLVGDERNLPTGPDNHGYWAWDNNDGGESHPYDWIEIAPAAGGSGTVTSCTGDDQTIQINLPFTFHYYGQDYTQISVCSNGWMAMGYTTTTDWSNSSIPNSDGPPAMIAPFWDDLYPVSGETQVCIFRDVIQNYFVVEWYNIGHYGATTIRETFEVILYDPAYWPTTTGDGIIVCQYSQVSNASSVTFGIENQTETDGIEYGYNGAYDVHAWPVEVGRSITYTTNISGPPPDIVLTLTPYNPPIQIPATGGSFDYNIAAENVGTSPATCQIWCDATLPGGSVVGPLLGPATVTMPVGFIGDRDRTQFVPSRAPSGMYSYNGYVGFYPSVIWGQDSFDFEKLATGDGSVVSEWANTGESFDDWLASGLVVAVPDVYSLDQNYPNPFNPVTTISYGLPEDAFVTLTIYDLLGRQVAVLVNGHRNAGVHEASFDATKLASGLYVYRIEAGEFTAVKKMILMK